MEEQSICAVCGEPYIPKRYNSQTCGKESCITVNKRRNFRAKVVADREAKIREEIPEKYLVRGTISKDRNSFAVCSEAQY